MSARRYDQCDGTCTVDCGHCKGQGPPWTPETLDVVERVMYASRSDLESLPLEEIDHEVRDLYRGDAREVLAALVSAGLLVTPQVQAVLDAAVEWRELVGDYPLPASDRTRDLMAAVDALGGER
jgi:hypothetical protein